jgi:hypothetical protein
MNLSDDDELHAHFETLRQADRSQPPDFRTMLDRAQSTDSPARRRAFPLVWMAAAAVIVLTVGIAVRETRQHGAGPYDGSTGSFGGGDTVSISNWKSPTASLLHTSGSDVLASSKILSSVLDGASRAAVQH